MKKAIFLSMILLSSFLYSKDLVFGIIPYKSNELIKNAYKPFINYLEKNTNKKVRIHIAKDYNDIIKMIKLKEVDFAMIGSYLYIKNQTNLKNTKYIASGLRKLNNKITSTFNSLIITTQDSQIKSVKDIKNKIFAFTDKNSTAGFVFPNYILKEEGIDYKKDFKKCYFLKKHDRVIKALLSNSIDAGAVYDKIAYDTQKKHPNKIRILARSYPIPLDAYIATSRLSKKEFEKLNLLFLKYKGSNEDEIIGFTKVTKDVFDSIKEVAKSN